MTFETRGIESAVRRRWWKVGYCWAMTQAMAWLKLRPI